MFSRACEYALRAALCVSVTSTKGARMALVDIAKEIDAPLPFTAKILQTLVRKKILSSAKGPNGGFFLEAEATPVTLSAIVMAIDGTDDALHTCSLGLKNCSDQFPCPIHNEVKAYKDHVRSLIKKTTIQQLSSDLVQGKTFLKNNVTRKK